MTWNIAQAKQQLSEVVRLTAQEPQAIYNRDRPVAVLVNPVEYAEFERWRTAQQALTLADQFSAARAALDEAGIAELPLPERTRLERPNAFVQMLAEEASHAAR